MTSHSRSGAQCGRLATTCRGLVGKSITPRVACMRGWALLVIITTVIVKEYDRRGTRFSPEKGSWGDSLSTRQRSQWVNRQCHHMKEGILTAYSE
jgi:hypothetical protein